MNDVKSTHSAMTMMVKLFIVSHHTWVLYPRCINIDWVLSRQVGNQTFRTQFALRKMHNSPLDFGQWQASQMVSASIFILTLSWFVIERIILTKTLYIWKSSSKHQWEGYNVKLIISFTVNPSCNLKKCIIIPRSAFVFMKTLSAWLLSS